RPGAKIEPKKLQTRNHPVRTIQDARKEAKKSPYGRVTVTAEGKEYSGSDPDPQREKAHHICRDRKFDQLPTDGNGHSTIQSCIHAVCGLDQPAVQFFFSDAAVFLGAYALPQLFVHVHQSHRMLTADWHIEFLEVALSWTIRKQIAERVQ